jgi:hypothetical protein
MNVSELNYLVELIPGQVEEPQRFIHPANHIEPLTGLQCKIIHLSVYLESFAYG